LDFFFWIEFFIPVDVEWIDSKSPQQYQLVKKLMSKHSKNHLAEAMIDDS